MILQSHLNQPHGAHRLTGVIALPSVSSEVPLGEGVLHQLFGCQAEAAAAVPPVLDPIAGHQVSDLAVVRHPGRNVGGLGRQLAVGVEPGAGVW